MTNEEQTKQPRSGGGPCDAGDGYAGCDMGLTWECKQCGRREAADDSAKTPLADRTAFAAAHGWASLRLIAEPTRAGWWLAWDGHYPDLHFVTEMSTRPGLWIYHDFDWLKPSDLDAEGWAGPVELEKASPVEPTPNVDVSDECPPRAPEREKP